MPSSAGRAAILKLRLLGLIPVLAALALGVVVWGRAAPGRAAADLDVEEQAFLALINDYRAASGAGPLSLNTQLTDASQWMSDDMATKNYWPDATYCAQFGLGPHCDSLGRTVVERIVAFGSDPFTALGENLARSVFFSSAQSVFDAWKNSPWHNANMLTAAYTVIGIGRTSSQSGVWYWTTDFGRLTASPAATPSPTPFPTPTSTPTLSPTPTPTLSPTPTPTPSPTPSPTPLPAAAGDVDCSDNINSLDSLWILRFVASLEPFAACLSAADVNCSGHIDSLDALVILLYVAGLPPAPAPEGCAPVGSLLPG